MVSLIELMCPLIERGRMGHRGSSEPTFLVSARFVRYLLRAMALVHPPSLLSRVRRRDFLIGAGSVTLVGCGGPPAVDEPLGDAPSWKLEDVQPMSERHGELYGLEAFEGSAMLVALLAGGCNTCQGIASALDPLLEEWRDEGMKIEFCAINDADDGNPQLLYELCSYPVFQDTKQVRAWDQHGGSRDDIFVYSGTGVFVEYFPFGGKPVGNPILKEGQANLKAALQRALGG